MSDEEGKVADIDVDKIAVGKSQARQRKVSVDDDLLASIQKVGLVQPIIVCKRKEGDFDYELLAGQRRLLAHKKLGLDKIKAILRPVPKDEYDAKRLSIAENAPRKDMIRQDYVDAIDMFMKKYGTTAAVSEELGLSHRTVRKYLTYARLPEKVQEAVNNKEVLVDSALKALDAFGGDESTVDPQEIITLAKEMKKLSSTQQKKAVEIKLHEPGVSVDELVKETKKQVTTHSIEIEVTEDQAHRLDKFKDDKKLVSTAAAVEEIIDVGLETSGY